MGRRDRGGGKLKELRTMMKERSFDQFKILFFLFSSLAGFLLLPLVVEYYKTKKKKLDSCLDFPIIC